MDRRNSRNDEVMCVICDLWWLWLLLFIVLIALILTRNYWLPLFGANPSGVATPSATVSIPLATEVLPGLTNQAPSPVNTQSVLPPTATTEALPTRSSPLGVGSVAPDFTLPQLAGGDIKLSDQRGKPVLMVFFASFDSYSQAEAPTLLQIAQAYGDQLALLPIDIAYNDRKEDVSRFVSDYGWAFPVALDESGSVMSLYQQNSIPAHIFIDSSGVITAMEGTLTAEQLKEKTSKLMDQ
jgi:peroxiredoxin